MLRHILTNLIVEICLLLAIPACSEGSDSPAMASQSQSGPATWCAAVCSWDNRCTGPVSSSCQRGCLQDTDDLTYFSHVTADFLVKQAACINGAACTDWKSMSDACYKSVAPTLSPTAAVIDFCKAMSATFFDCYYADDDLTFCASDFAAWSDAGAVRAKACVSVECASLNTCLGNAFNGTN